jgi:hypothetical protein
VNRVDVEALAWSLADAASTLMNRADRTRLCAKIGAGEQDSAILDVLARYANANAELPFALALPIQKWIDGYAGSDTEQVLRHIYDRISVSAEDAGRSEPAAANAGRPLQRLVARRSESAARVAASRRSTYSSSRTAVRGSATCVEELVDAAVKARRVAHATTEIAVHKARSMGWSWERIAVALGGNASPELLRHTFGRGATPLGLRSR